MEQEPHNDQLRDVLYWTVLENASKTSGLENQQFYFSLLIKIV